MTPRAGKRSTFDRPMEREEGFALAITLLVMAVLLLLGSALLSLSSTETQIAFNERDGLQAFYLAEAGVERAIAELNANASYAGTGGEVAFGAGTYTVTVTTPAGSTTQRVISATGCVPSCVAPSPARKQIQVTAERISPFRWPLFGDVRVRLGSGGIGGGGDGERDDDDDDDNGGRRRRAPSLAATDSYNSNKGPYGGLIFGTPPQLNIGSHGDVGSNGDIRLDSGVVVRGDVVASGEVRKESLALVTGQIVEGEAKHPLAPVEKSHCDLAKEHKDRLEVERGEIVTIGPGTYYYDRIRIAQGAVVQVSGEASIYVDGRVHIQQEAVVGLKPGTAVVNDAKQAAGKGVGEAVGLSTAAASGKAEVKVDPEKITPGLLQPPSFFTISSCSDAEVKLEGNVIFSGAIYAPKAHVDVKRAAIVYGSVIGERVEVDGGVFFHYDEALKGKSPGRFRPLAGTWQELFPLEGKTAVVSSPHQYPASPQRTQ